MVIVLGRRGSPWLLWLLAAACCAVAGDTACVGAADVRTANLALPVLLPGEARFENACLGPRSHGSILQAYVRRHQQAVEYLRRVEPTHPPAHRQDHAPASSSGSPKFLVWRCRDKSHMGGIGDRLKRLGSLFTTAVATRRVLLVDFADFSDIFEARAGPAGGVEEWRFSELEGALREKAPVWWEYGGEHEDEELVTQDGRLFANLTAAGLLTDGDVTQDFADDVVFTTDGGSLPYLFGHYRDHSIRDAVEGNFPEGLFEGCVFHAFFSAQEELRQLFHREVLRLNLAPAPARTNVAVDMASGGELASPHRRRVVAVHIRAEDSIWSPSPRDKAANSLQKLGLVLDCAYRRALIVPRTAGDGRPEPWMAARILVITNDRKLKEQLHVLMTAESADIVGDGAAAAARAPPSVRRSRRLLATSSVAQPCHSSHSNCDTRSLLESWADYFLLASADFIMMERSGFSMTAASVGGVPPGDRIFGKECTWCLGAPGHQWCANVSYNHNI